MWYFIGVILYSLVIFGMGYLYGHRIGSALKHDLGEVSASLRKAAENEARKL